MDHSLSQEASYDGWTIKFTGRSWTGKWIDSWDAECRTARRILTHLHPGCRQFSTKSSAIRSAIEQASQWIDKEGKKWARELEALP